MPKAEKEVQIAHNGSRIAAVYGFSTIDGQRLEQVLRTSARIIAPTPIGKERNKLYASHKDQILAQFQGQWGWSKTSQKWVMSSISKVLSNYLFDYNKKHTTPTPKTVTKAKSTKKNDARKPNASQPKNDAPRTDVNQQKNFVPYVKEENVPSRSRRSPRTFTSINKKSPSPGDQLVIESPFDEPRYPTDSVLQSTEHSPMEPRSDAAQSQPKLADIILVVYPSSSDPWNREMFSFPLWRCQVPVNGRDAAPESLRDWRDLSFDDFLRQLKSEQALTSEEMIVWSEFSHVVTSDMTFASAVQEQHFDASLNGTAPNEATFAIVGSKLLALLLSFSC